LYRLALKKNKLPTDTFDKICIDALNGLEPGQHIQNYIDLKKNLLK